MRPLMVMLALAPAGCSVLFGDPRMVAQTSTDGGIGGGTGSGSDGGGTDGNAEADSAIALKDAGGDGGRMRDSGPAPSDLTAPDPWMAMSAGTSEGLQSVWRCDASTLVAAGTNGTLVTFAAGVWTSTQVGPETLHSVGGSDCSNLFLVGDAGAIYGGAVSGSFTKQASGVTSALRAVGAVGNTVRVAGDAGVILRLSSGNLWTPEVSSTSSNLSGLFGSTQLGWYAVGDGGLVLSSGTPWQSVPSGVSPALWAVFGGSKLLYAAGDLGTAVRINTNTNNGMGFTRLTTPTTAGLHGVWVSGMSEVWVVGDGGVILHSVDSGGSWSFEPSYTTSTLRAIWGTSTSDLWIVGDGGTVLRHR